MITSKLTMQKPLNHDNHIQGSKLEFCLSCEYHELQFLLIEKLIEACISTRDTHADIVHAGRHE